MNKGNIIASNVESFNYSKNAVAEVLKTYDDKAIVRFSNGWKNIREQIVSQSNFRIIPTA